MYEDFTRQCAEKFSVVVHHFTFDICESEEGYNRCPLYMAISEDKTICPSLDTCTKSMGDFTTKFIKLLIRDKKTREVFYTQLEAYCFSDKYETCARYKKIQNGEKLPNSLRPDGQKMSFFDFIMKKH